MNFPIVIKKRQALFPLFAFISAVMLGISLFFLFCPFIRAFADAMSDKELAFYATSGGTGTLFFSFCFFCLVFGIVLPPVGLKIAEDGLYDYTAAGVGAGFIPEDAIISLRVFGNKKGRYLGIKIDSNRLNELSDNKILRQEIENNINSGLPAVIIRQNDLNIPVSALLRTILEAYSAKGVGQTDDGQIEEAALNFHIDAPAPIAELSAPPAEKQPEIKAEEVARLLPPDEESGESGIDGVGGQNVAPVPLYVPDEESGESGIDGVGGQGGAPVPTCISDEEGDESRESGQGGAEKARIKSVDDLLRQLNIFPASDAAQNKDGEKKGD